MTLQDFDDRILEPAQKFSDWLHALTGLDSIQQARFCAGITAIGWLFGILYWQRANKTFDWIVAIMLVERTYRCVFETDTDRLVRSECKRGLRNRRRIDPYARFHRLFVLSFAPIVFVAWQAWLVIVLVGVFGCALLEACDVQTPRPGRIREALNRFAERTAAAVAAKGTA